MTCKRLFFNVVFFIVLFAWQAMLFSVGIELFSISYNENDGFKVDCLYNTVHDEEAIRQKEKDDAIKLAALLKENEKLDHSIIETDQDTLKKQNEVIEARKRVIKKQQDLRRKLKECL